MNALSPRVVASGSPTVRSWLVKLHESSAGNSATQDALDRMQLMLDHFEIGRYSDSAFTRRSLEHVASKCRFWPSYGELCKALDEWLATAAAPRLAARPDDRGLDAMDQSWVTFYHRRVQEIGEATSFRWGSYDAEIENMCSLVKQMSPKAWRVLRPQDFVIQDQPTERQISEVAHALRMPGSPLSGQPTPEEKPVSRAAPVSDDALRAMRVARGHVVPEPAAQKWPEEVYGQAPA